MEATLRRQVLRAAVRDRMFLKTVCHDVSPNDFPDRAEQIVATIALKFWDEHNEPIGALLRSDAEDAARHQRLNQEERKQLRQLIDDIQGTKMDLVPIKALEDRVLALKRDTFFDHALEQVVTAQEKGRLDATVLEDIVEQARRELADRVYVATDYMDELEKRILRRRLNQDTEKYPRLMIDPIDEEIRAIGRGHFAIFVGPYSSGKSLFLMHVAMAYAMQGLNVIYVTLEDPKDILENRMDASMGGIPMSKLNLLPNRLRHRFNNLKQMIRGRIKIVDATEGGFTISKCEKMWDQLRSDGFIADAIIIDYDEEIECEKKFSGEMQRKQEFMEIYKRIRRMAKKLDVLVWTASQTKRGTADKKVITGDMVGEDISKIKKSFLAIGIGKVPDEDNVTNLYIMRHRLDRSKFSVEVVSDFASGLAVDAEATRLRMRKPKR
jgi:replicative DNA helicase